ncbi:chloroplast lumen common protein family [Trifolium medium]|uniref:Chloroplast lumen common protein family n=1 Tax=Trifolium medium TaxID=97028 RepID=A0A392N2D7_9FABA|nr:chloroplast lumen common protein family [Trifolium medium]
MKPNTQAFVTGPPHVTCFHRATVSRAALSETHLPPPNQKLQQFRTTKRRRVNLSLHRSSRIIAAVNDDVTETSVERAESKEWSRARSNRRGVLMAPFLAAGASFLLSATTTRAAEEEKVTPVEVTAVKPEEVKKIEEEVITSRIYDATAIGEPLAIGKEKGKVWEKMMNARVVYLGEAEQVPVRDDKELELEIVKNLHKRCVEIDKRLSLAIEAFPSDLQEPLNQYMDKKYAF